ncbi:MAG: hypothetical protein ACO25B_02365 [Chitinophagaceae bacterium]
MCTRGNPYFYFLLLLAGLPGACSHSGGKKPELPAAFASVSIQDTLPGTKTIDTATYLKIMKAIANGDSSGKWPPAVPLPMKGALLPFHRVVAYYGNFYSTQMGVLGEYDREKVIEMLQKEVRKWEAADTSTPVIPAIHYIAVTAQARSGKDGKYRARMPVAEINKAISMSREIKGIVFLDIQVGLSRLEDEIPLLEEFLVQPDVHLGIDPEYSMKTGARPGTLIGSFDALDINYAVDYLAGLVQRHHLPPKILVVHRFTEAMVTNYKKIQSRPEVQIVINMDGFGPPANKRNSYLQFIYKQPVQFTGFKLFYHVDTRGGKPLMQAREVLGLVPKPVYIQYQ